MKQALIINNDTMTRATVIGYRTGSEFLAGAKAMMIQELKRKLSEGITSFTFLKKDGSVRFVKCATTNKALVAQWTNGRGDSREHFATTAFLELTETGIQWRSFRWESIIEVF